MRTSFKNLLHCCANYANDSYTQIVANNNENLDVIKETSTDTVIYIITNDETIYITGPGSASVTDWSLDFQIWRTKVDYFNNSLVHAGFMKIYESIKSQLHSTLNNIMSSNRFRNSGEKALFRAFSITPFA